MFLHVTYSLFRVHLCCCTLIVLPLLPGKHNENTVFISGRSISFFFFLIQLSSSLLNTMNEYTSKEAASIKITTLLSLPPEASSWWSVLHLRPHTSCLCPCSRLSDCSGGVRTSLCRIIRSRLPEDSWSAFHARAPAERQSNADRLFLDPFSLVVTWAFP